MKRAAAASQVRAGHMVPCCFPLLVGDVRAGFVCAEQSVYFKGLFERFEKEEESESGERIKAT